jgi:hypothetical protein
LFRQQQQFGMAHFRGRNFGALERMVFDDYNSSLYASKSTIVMDDWHHFFDFRIVRFDVGFARIRARVRTPRVHRKVVKSVYQLHCV